MATYTNISEQDMRGYFAVQPGNWQQVHPEGVKELTFGLRVAINLTLRVFTGIAGGQSRAKGKDAIRVCLFHRDTDGNVRLVGGDRRVHRVEGWRNNLTNRLDGWREQLGPKCPKCGSHTVRRKSRIGQFWGCSNYPGCKSIQSIG